MPTRDRWLPAIPKKRNYQRAAASACLAFCRDPSWSCGPASRKAQGRLSAQVRIKAFRRHIRHCFALGVLMARPRQFSALQCQPDCQLTVWQSGVLSVGEVWGVSGAHVVGSAHLDVVAVGEIGCWPTIGAENLVNCADGGRAADVDSGGGVVGEICGVGAPTRRHQQCCNCNRSHRRRRNRRDWAQFGEFHAGIAVISGCRWGRSAWLAQAGWLRLATS